jgi:hypothetical protein
MWSVNVTVPLGDRNRHKATQSRRCISSSFIWLQSNSALYCFSGWLILLSFKDCSRQLNRKFNIVTCFLRILYLYIVHFELIYLLFPNSNSSQAPYPLLYNSSQFYALFSLFFLITRRVQLVPPQGSWVCSHLHGQPASGHVPEGNWLSWQPSTASLSDSEVASWALYSSWAHLMSPNPGWNVGWLGLFLCGQPKLSMAMALPCPEVSAWWQLPPQLLAFTVFLPPFPECFLSLGRKSVV